MGFSQSFQLLEPQDELVDFFYIDDAIVSEDKQTDGKTKQYGVIDSPDKVQARLGFARLMMHQLKLEIPSWNYTLLPGEIFYI